MKLSECYVGLKFEKLTIKKIVRENKFWVCYCDCECGTKNKRILMSNIKEGHTTSCGCGRAIKIPNWNIEDIKKQVFSLYGDEFEVLEKEYINARKPMKFKHKNCGKIFTTSFDNMKNKNGTHCRACLGLVITKGLNDLWTARPDVASMLENKNDGYKFGVGSSQKTNFICPNCLSINYKSIATVTQNGLCCNACSDNISYPNKFIYHLLKILNETFEREKFFEWCKNKPFDIYIENKNLIIEMDGGIGHGNRGFGKNWREPQYGNDDYKDKITKERGIKVIRIDCDYPQNDRFEYIKENIIHSELSNIYDFSKVDWDEIDVMAQKNIFLQIVEDLKSGMYKCDIAKKYSISTSTVGRYFKRATEIGLCEREYKKKHIYNTNKPVDMFDKNNQRISNFPTLTDAANFVGVSVSAISNCCKGKSKTSGGYIWRYAD